MQGTYTKTVTHKGNFSKFQGVSQYDHTDHILSPSVNNKRVAFKFPYTCKPILLQTPL